MTTAPLGLYRCGIIYCYMGPPLAPSCDPVAIPLGPQSWRLWGFGTQCHCGPIEAPLRLHRHSVSGWGPARISLGRDWGSVGTPLEFRSASIDVSLGPTAVSLGVQRAAGAPLGTHLGWVGIPSGPDREPLRFHRGYAWGVLGPCCDSIVNCVRDPLWTHCGPAADPSGSHWDPGGIPAALPQGSIRAT